MIRIKKEGTSAAAGDDVAVVAGDEPATDFLGDGAVGDPAAGLLRDKGRTVLALPGADEERFREGEGEATDRGLDEGEFLAGGVALEGGDVGAAVVDEEVLRVDGDEVVDGVVEEEDLRIDAGDLVVGADFAVIPEAEEEDNDDVVDEVEDNEVDARLFPDDDFGIDDVVVDVVEAEEADLDVVSEGEAVFEVDDKAGEDEAILFPDDDFSREEDPLDEVEDKDEVVVEVEVEVDVFEPTEEEVVEGEDGAGLLKVAKEVGRGGEVNDLAGVLAAAFEATVEDGDEGE